MGMEIGWLSLVISIIGAIVIGSVWFGPLFGEIFMRGIGFKSMAAARQEYEKNKKKGAAKQMYITYAIQILGALLTAALVGALINFNEIANGVGNYLFVLFVIAYGVNNYAMFAWMGKTTKWIWVAVGGQAAIQIYYWLVYLLLGAQMMLMIG